MADGYAGSNRLNDAGYTQAAPPVNNPSVFNSFEGMQAEAQHLLVRASNLADRLCGSLPPSAGTAEKGVSANGLLEDTAIRVQTTRAMIASATAAIERIEGKLP